MAKLALNGGSPIRTDSYPEWPIFDGKALEALKSVLESRVWGIGGSKKKGFEETFAAYQHAKHGVSVTNGTAALEISLRALGVGCGDEVVVPPYTFMATVIAVLYVNAIPIFADIDPETYTINPDSVKSVISEKTKAILPVHIAGRPADMDALMSIAKQFSLSILEDACQAWGSEWKGRRVGAIGDIGAFSFQSSKNLTSGEGGIIVTNDSDLHLKAWSLHNCGRLPQGVWYKHPLPGGNYRMTEFQAALLLAQLDRFDQQTERRMENARYLDTKLNKIDGINHLKNDERITRHACHLYLFKFNPEAFDGISKATLAKVLQAEGIPISVGYSTPVYKEPYLKHFEKCPLSCPQYGKHINYSKLSLPVTEKACYTEGLWFPQYVLLGYREDMDDIVAAFEKVKENLNELKES